MNMISDVLPSYLAEEKIEYYGFLPFSLCRVINKPLLERKVGFAPLSICVFAVPYYTGKHENRNISLYAVSKDYHLYFKELFGRICGKLEKAFPYNHFIGFADSSPIAEVNAAARSGLGIVGDKGQLIIPKYGSHVFIGEILTDMPASYTETEIKYCSHCGECSKACPASDGECFSAMNQQKGELSDDAKKIMLKTGIGWGCDICREVCPHNADALPTPIDFFYADNIEKLTAEGLDGMSDSEFSERAYSFRGRKTIMRNILFLESKFK